MVGLIWFVQLVHYPLFAAVGPDNFIAYETQHTRRTSWVVAMFMPVEAITAAWLMVDRPEGVSAGLVIAGFILVAMLWFSTALWQAPLHGRLTMGFDSHRYRQLVRSNWVRTGLWSKRGILVLLMIGQVIG